MKYRGLLMTLAFSALITCIFFGKLLLNLNSTFFAHDGDGLRGYFAAKYHVLHEPLSFKTSAMNYPFGENLFYLDSQPLISNLIILLKPISDLSDYTIGIINGLMLLGLFLAPLFIFLFLKEFDIPDLIGALISIGIAFLSPQISRMGGHFSLSYVFIIPCIFFLTIRYYKRQNYFYSCMLFLVALFAAGTHLYLFAIYAMILILFWIGFVIYYRKHFKKGYIFHFAFQVIMPVLVYSMILKISDPVSDRVAFPWGFFFYRAYPEGVFLPLFKPYLKFITSSFSSLNYVTWEGRSYIGLAASIVSIILICRMIFLFVKSRFRWYTSFSVNRELDFLFLISFLILLYSFGLPFIIPPLEGLVEHFGFLRNLRALGRFTWVFFYGSNIVTFIFLWKLNWSYKNFKISRIVFYLALMMLFYDAYLNIRHQQAFLNNKLAEYIDSDNEFPVNQWISGLAGNDYNAIIPMPNYFTGTDLFGRPSTQKLIKTSFLISLRTGIPLTGLIAARSSLKQTRDHIELMFSPVRLPNALAHYSHKGSYLIISDTTGMLTDTEFRLRSNSNKLYSSDEIEFLEITADQLLQFYQSEAEKNYQQFKIFYSHLNDSISGYDIIMPVGNQNIIKADELNHWRLVYDGNIKASESSNEDGFYLLIGDITHDLVLNTEVRIILKDEADQVIESLDYVINSQIESVIDNAVLVKLSSSNKTNASKVIVMMRNKRMTNQQLNISNLFVIY